MTEHDPRSPLYDGPEEERCPECEGEAGQVSECCGAAIDSDILICSDCKDHSEIEVCETCNGEGIITTN